MTPEIKNALLFVKSKTTDTEVLEAITFLMKNLIKE